MFTRKIPRQLFPALEGLREEGQGSGEESGAADSLGGPRQDQHQGRLRYSAKQRPDGEYRQTDQEQPLSTEAVGERPRREQERRQCQRVRVDHPLHVGERGVQAALDFGQRNGHDRDIEQEHESRRAYHDEGPPLTVHGHPSRFARSIRCASVGVRLL
jgi:hypothetical protein